MQVLQTDDDPPNHGKIIFATIGWIWNSRNADRKTVVAKTTMALIRSAPTAAKGLGEPKGNKSGGDQLAGVPMPSATRAPAMTSSRSAST